MAWLDHFQIRSQTKLNRPPAIRKRFFDFIDYVLIDLEFTALIKENL